MTIDGRERRLEPQLYDRNDHSLMTIDLIQLITSADPAIRNQSLEQRVRGATTTQLLEACRELDRFRRSATNLYERVRALFFLSAIYRYHLPDEAACRQPTAASRTTATCTC